MVIGAALGAAVSLFDRKTRDSLKIAWQQRTERVNQFCESLETVVYTAKKIKDIAETTPKMIEWMEETYRVIANSRSNK